MQLRSCAAGSVIGDLEGVHFAGVQVCSCLLKVECTVLLRTLEVVQIVQIVQMVQSRSCALHNVQAAVSSVPAGGDLRRCADVQLHERNCALYKLCKLCSCARSCAAGSVIGACWGRP